MLPSTFDGLTKELVAREEEFRKAYCLACERVTNGTGELKELSFVAGARRKKLI